MGWFDEQIRQRKQLDDEAFSDSFINIASAVLGGGIAGATAPAQDAIEAILRYYRVKPRELPDAITGLNEQLEYLMRPYGIMRRNVRLEKGWYKNAIGAMLGTKLDGTVVALIPTGLSGYKYFDTETGKYIRLSKKTEELINKDAICFYKPLPLKKTGAGDLIKYAAQTLSTADITLFALAALAVALVGLLGPVLNNLLFSRVLESGSGQLLVAITVFMVCVSLSTLILEAVKALLMARIDTKLGLSVEAAVMMRILSLPAGFFKEHSSGELSSRSEYVSQLCNMMVDALLSTGLTSIFSLVYLPQIFAYAPALAAPAMGVILVTFAFSAISALVQMSVSRKQMELSARESGMSYALISGIQKLKLAGAEKRAFARWGALYSKKARLMYDPPAFIKLNSVIALAITLTGTIIMYASAVKSGVTVAEYYAFSVSYGMVSGAFMQLSAIALTAAQIKPVLEMAKPLLEAVPEVSEGKQVVTRLSGGIEVSNVSFRYTDTMPLVLDDLSLKIRPGQYVAIVGTTGCGKSTLMRLLLGFETPQKGAVYYDGKDLSTIDLKSLRRSVGVVMQNGKLFSGDIYSNITISAPWLTLEQAWEAAELAGIAEDIRRMPMGMNTLISEGGGGISGGQRQRLMIARAIAPRPKVMMFDEATSALDNLTQKKVAESLDSLSCTRIVIAHRLSTIRQCDRIIVLDKGKIIEDGGYDELLRLNGYFAELVARQRLDDTKYVGKTTLF